MTHAVTTAEDGSFEIKTVAGAYTIEADQAGFVKKGRQLELKGGETMSTEIILRPRPKQPVAEVTKNMIVVRQSVHFLTGEARLAPDAAAVLDNIVDVLVDNEVSVKNLARFATKNAFYSEAVQVNGFWHVKIVKGYPCEPPQEKAAGGRPAEAGIAAEEPTREVEKDVFLVIATETMGKDETLGRTLMKGFFETMKVYREVPHTIFFMNTGVKLTTTNDETIPLLKEIEEMGVEIFSCGTCLDYFNLTSELKVGFRGGTPGSSS